MADIQIKSLDGFSFDGYLAVPSGGNGAGLIVIHGIGGLDASVRRLCDHYASLGYIALCPDLYARQSKNGRSVMGSPLEKYKTFDVEAGVRDLLATLAHLRTMPGCGGKVGAVGYCLGGRMAFLMATRSDVDCSVGYDNVGLENMLDEIYDIRMPLLLHFGEEDKLVPSSVRQKILTALARNKVITTRLYAQADHGFCEPESAKFHPDNAAKAAKETEAFLAEHLKV